MLLPNKEVCGPFFGPHDQWLDRYPNTLPISMKDRAYA